MSCFAFLSHESLFMLLSLTSLYNLVITVVKLMSAWYLDSKLSTCSSVIVVYSILVKKHCRVDNGCMATLWVMVWLTMGSYVYACVAMEFGT